ncbi:MAG: hypothetical protein HQK49_21710 [Oligoflexia bacterium]|nr:hypothetical protein [Oligoflexia bacterium]
MSLQDELISLTNKENISSISIYRHTVYVDSKYVGLSSIANNDCQLRHEYKIINDVGKLHLKTADKLAKYFKSENFLERSIGLATINSYINGPQILPKTEIINAFDLVKEKVIGKNLAIIGGFPNVKNVRENYNCRNIWVFELNKQYEYELGPDKYAEYLPNADVVLMTATTLLNNTFFEVHKHLNNSYNVMVGPSTPMHDLMFDYKMHALSGTVVTDKIESRLFLEQGASYHDCRGLTFVTYLKK